MIRDNRNEVLQQNKIQQAREIQNNLRNATSIEQQPQLKAQPPQISRFEYDGNGLKPQPGTYLREGVEEGKSI